MNLEDWRILYKARDISREIGMYESLHVTYYAPAGRYLLETRTFAAVEVDWTTHFRLTQEQARAIVHQELATWWPSVPEDKR